MTKYTRGISERGSKVDEELVGLTMAIVAINGCNRLAISRRTAPGTYPAGGGNSGIAVGTDARCGHRSGNRPE